MTTSLSNVDLPHLPHDSCLNGRNYLYWAQFIKWTFKGMGRLNHIEGVTISRDNPNFQIWDNGDSGIISYQDW